VDKTMELAKKFDVVGEKSMFGKKYTGILRSTFLLDTKGTVIQERKNISANNHAKNVLEKVTKVVMDK
jgi:peroxiredoxin Q/BCP